MQNPVYTYAFKKDVKLAQKRRPDMVLLKRVVEEILSGKPLAAKHKNHRLTGSWNHHWECHLSPDWLLIYKFQGDDSVVERTSSHADLF